MSADLTCLAVIGGGAWGTALACVLGPRFREVRLWVFEPGLAAEILTSRTNRIYLPEIPLPENVLATGSLPDALAGAGIVISVMPSHAVRDLSARMTRYLEPGARLVSATKGLEAVTLLRMSEIIRKVTGERFAVAVLSGPSFAREVALSKPAALVVASESRETACELQTAFSGPTFRLYSSDDVVGTEIGGALKNVIAIGAGICEGLGLGHNAVAALITRGLAELTRLAVALGGKPETMAGLAGLGDLVLTCTGDLSRNRHVGMQLAQGLKLTEILSSTSSVAEGVKTTSVALELGRKCGVELPITAEMHAVLDLGKSPPDAIQALMTRSLRNEG